mgnify:CR=1 FL=1
MAGSESCNGAAARSSDPQRLALILTGAVQGVGFRPFVYRLACELDLAGSVQNCSGRVAIEVEDGGDGIRWHVNDRRRVHVYERCSQFSILQRLPTAYMWASPMPRRALEQYHLVLKKCPAQRQQMRDVLVYPDKGRLRPEEQAFVDLLHKEAASTVK